MKIAFITSSRNIVPPVRSGGVEQSIYYLAREMVRMKHNIDLYAAPGSKIKGVNIKMISPFPMFVKQGNNFLQEKITDYFDNLFLANFFNSNISKEYDIIQYFNYNFYEIIPFVHCSPRPIIIQINYPHDKIYPYIKKTIIKIKNVYYLPVSLSIKKKMPFLNYLDPVRPAIDFGNFQFSSKIGKYLLFIGRVCADKGTHIAINISKKIKKELIIAGPVREGDTPYFKNEIMPFVDNKLIKYFGEVNFKNKIFLYKNALATLMPIQWDDPCPTTVFESMACGTPVIAFNRSSMKEIIKNKVSGMIVKDGDINSMANVVKKISSLDRTIIRQWAERNFSIDKEAKKYEKICFDILNN